MKIMRRKTYKKMVVGLGVGCGVGATMGAAGIATGVIANVRLKNYQKSTNISIQGINASIAKLQADESQHKRMTKQLQEVCKLQGFLQ